MCYSDNFCTKLVNSKRTLHALTRQCMFIVCKAPDKKEYQVYIFLFLHEIVCCGYSLEAPWHGASYKYPQHIFSCRNKKTTHTLWCNKTILSGAMSLESRLGMHKFLVPEDRFIYIMMLI